MGMPPMGSRPPMPPQGGPAPAPGGPGAARPDIMELWMALPPEQQMLLAPEDPITAVLFEQLRDLTDEEGMALLEWLSTGTPVQLRALAKGLPQLALLVDMFDDGEINGSTGVDPSTASGAAGGGAPPANPMTRGGGDMGAPNPMAGMGSPARPDAGGRGSYDDEPGNRMNSIRAA